MRGSAAARQQLIIGTVILFQPLEQSAAVQAWHFKEYELLRVDHSIVRQLFQHRGSLSGAFIRPKNRAQLLLLARARLDPLEALFIAPQSDMDQAVLVLTE